MGNWATPQPLFDKLNAAHKFTLDPCASHSNHKCENYYTVEDDGLKQSWYGHSVFMNPPYGRVIGDWIEKAYEETGYDNTFVCGLLPARTDTKWFWKYCWLPHKEFGSDVVDIEFICGRLKFGNSKNSAPFPSVIVRWYPRL